MGIHQGRMVHMARLVSMIRSLTVAVAQRSDPVTVAVVVVTVVAVALNV